MDPLLERSVVALIVLAAAVYAIWAVMPQIWRLRLVTRLAAFPPTAAPAARLLQRWRAAQGCAACSGTPSEGARAASRGPGTGP